MKKTLMQSARAIFARFGTHGRAGVIASAAVLVLAGSAYAARAIRAPENLGSAAAIGAVSTQEELVATVGSEADAVSASLASSWPGEVMSYGSYPIQPTREGTIVEWRVKIGERVRAGQVIARLSAPPAMPELVQMLAMQSEGRARMNAKAESTQKFTEANNAQLRAQLESAATATKDALATLSGTAGASERALAEARQAAQAMRESVRTMIERMLTNHAGIISNAYSSAAFRSGSLNRAYGILDPENQTRYEESFIRLVAELKDPAALPVESTKTYLASFVRLANTSSRSDIMDIRDMASDDQADFLDMLAEYRDAEAEVAMKDAEYRLMAAENKRMFAEQKRMIEEKIAENEKMLSMAQAESAAASAAYAVVAGSIQGGLAITAPASGVVSAINKKTGEFVEPGMPVATIDVIEKSERFVRFQIPVNTKKPAPGSILSVIRPGFAQDVRKVRLTGVGASLDMTGTYMADATFIDPIDWPVSASVRVVAPEESSSPLARLSAIWWDQSGKPRVWAISPAGRIYSREVAVGRTLGSFIEITDGLSRGDRYLIAPTPDIREDMLLDDLAPAQAPASAESAEEPADEHAGHSM